MDVSVNIHTERCCKKCGCEYGCDVPMKTTSDKPRIVCSVVNGSLNQSFSCGINDVCNKQGETQ